MKRRVDGLLFRTDEPHLHFPVGKGEDLGPKHGRVGDADQLMAFLVRVVAGDDEKPGPVGGAVDVGGLNLAVDLLLFGRQAVEVQLGRRRQGLDDILQGITHPPAEEVEEQDGNLRVGEKERDKVVLAKVFTDGMVIGKVPVVYQGFIQPDERMGPPGVPDPPPRGISLVGDPDVGLEIFEPVILRGLLGIPDDLQDHHVPAVREDERPLLAEGGVKTPVQLETVLEDELVFHLPAVGPVELISRREIRERVFFDPDEVTVHIGGFHLQVFHLPVVADGGDPLGMVNLQERVDKRGLDGGASLIIQEGHLEEIVFPQHLGRDAKGFRRKADGGDPPAFSVPPIVHLPGGLDDVPSANGHGRSKPGDPAASFFLRLPERRLGEAFDHLSPGGEESLDFAPVAVHNRILPPDQDPLRGDPSFAPTDRLQPFPPDMKGLISSSISSG